MEIEIMNEGVARAARAVRAGKVLALPTDTVWGLLCEAGDPAALEQMYVRKGRPADKPFQVLCASVDSARALIEPHALAAHPTLERDFERLVSFWPGPLTLLMPAQARVPQRLRPGGVVGLRVPHFPVVQDLLEHLGGCAACTSLNRSGEAAVTTLEDARQHRELYDALFDAGHSSGQASTVFSVSERRVLRVGQLSEAQLLEALA